MNKVLRNLPKIPALKTNNKMSFFDEVFDKLFHKEQNPNLPYLSEQITRSDRFFLGYSRWLLKRNEVMREIKQAISSKQNNYNNSEIRCELMHSPYANGLLIFFHPSMEKSDFTYLFEFCKDFVKDLGYKQALADRKIYTKKEHIETIDRYYLKPKLNYLDDKQEQKFGNILIELHLDDDEPVFIKILATIYSDMNYLPAENFDKFIAQLFDY